MLRSGSKAVNVNGGKCETFYWFKHAAANKAGTLVFNYCPRYISLLMTAVGKSFILTTLLEGRTLFSF